MEEKNTILDIRPMQVEIPHCIIPNYQKQTLHFGLKDVSVWKEALSTYNRKRR